MQVILRAKLDKEILLPIEKKFEILPRIGEQIDLGDNAIASITMITHFIGNGFWYPGSIMRRNGIKSKWGVTCSFRTLMDVELSNAYHPHTAFIWNQQMGWDFAEWLDIDSLEEADRAI